MVDNLLWRVMLNVKRGQLPFGDITLLHERRELGDHCR